MSWFFLLLAGLIEILGVVMINKFVLTGKKIYILFIALQFTISFAFLSLAMKTISMGTAYAIWTGIGSVGGVIVGILFFKESKNLQKLLFISLIIFASIALKLIS